MQYSFLFLLLCGQATSFSSAPVDPESYSDSRGIAECAGRGSDGYIIRGQDSLPLEDLVAKLRGAEVTYKLPSINAVSTRGIAESLVRILRSDAAIKDVSPNCLVDLDPIETDSMTASTQSAGDPVPWGTDRVDSRDGTDGLYLPSGDGGIGAVVYVLDTGIRISHKEFEGRAEAGWSAGCGETPESCQPGWAYQGVIDDAVNEAELARTANNRGGPTDCNGHGTHCASTAAGRHYGIAPEATVVAVQVLSCEGSGSSAGIFAGIEWAVKDSAQRGKPGVISMSLGGPGGSGYDDIMDFAMDSGLFVSVAAGNEHLDACRFSPAYVSRVMTVGSTEVDDDMSSFSNYGSCVDIYAPGTGITAAWAGSDEQLATISGTSMACPHVSGAAAELVSADPSLSADAVKEKLLCMSTQGTVDLDRRARVKGTDNLFLYTGTDHAC